MAGLQEILVNNYVLKQITPNDVLNLLVYGKHNRYDFRTTSSLYVKRKESLDEVKKVLESKKNLYYTLQFRKRKEYFSRLPGK